MHTKWDEVIAVLQSVGCVVREPGGGSHWIIYHPGADWQESVPVHSNRAKPVYSKKLRNRIKELLDGENELWDDGGGNEDE